MTSNSEPLERYYDSGTLGGLIRSGFLLLVARRVRPRTLSRFRRLFLDNAVNYVLYAVLIVLPAIVLDGYQRLRTALTGQPRTHPFGSWQFYLHTGLREDFAHHTNETTGYHHQRPAEASDVDDLTAWVMSVIQLLWDYEALMGIIWDEWTMLRLVLEAAERVGLADHAPFVRFVRQWELARPYRAPLNGTYGDVRKAAFDAFIQPFLEVLPEEERQRLHAEYIQAAAQERQQYQEQMSLLSTLKSGRYGDSKREISLWDAAIGVIYGGKYYLVDVVDRNERGAPIAYGYAGTSLDLVRQGDDLYTLDGRRLMRIGDQLYWADSGTRAGYVARPAISRVKAQVEAILQEPWSAGYDEADEFADVMLAETPRAVQARLRTLLPDTTQAALEQLSYAPIIINWDEQDGSRRLAALRRGRRGVGDHALTVIRTDRSIVFDQSHIYFDGTWSLAMAEVLTQSALRWCERAVGITASEACPPRSLTLKGSHRFFKAAERVREPAEVSAETTIWDISNLFSLRKRLGAVGTNLTINDLLVITRILHAAHYQPSALLHNQIDELRSSTSAQDRHAAQRIDRSLERGCKLNPALLIPVDASLSSPPERIYPITFRNMADALVWLWDDAWEAYQAYRRIEPPDTPEGVEAYHVFDQKRARLIGNLRAFGYVLDGNKSVAMRGESINIGIIKLLVGLPEWLQHTLKAIPEYVLPLNEIIRGDEVYSNVGRVAPESSLSRFMTAKDDGNTKALAWGVMTDAGGRLIVTMRDFRPHVKPLIRAGRRELAAEMSQEYVEAFTAELIGLVARLSAMLQAQPPKNT